MDNIKAKKERIVWIDQFKAIGFIFVIMGHLEASETLRSWIYSFHMPLFLLATGLTFNIEKAYKTDFKTFFSVRFKRMIIPYFWLEFISLSMLYLRRFIVGATTPDLTEHLKGILIANTGVAGSTPCPPLYYIILLFFAEIGLWVVIRLTKGDLGKMGVLLTLLLTISLCTLKDRHIWHINVVPVAMLLIFIGRLLMNQYLIYREKIEKLRFAAYALIIAVLVAGGTWLGKFNGRISIHVNKYGQDFVLFIVSTLAMNIAIAMIAMKLPRTRLLTFIGKNTLFYMGIHSQVIKIFEQIFKGNIEKWWFIAFTTVAIYFLLVPVTLLAERFFPFVMGKTDTRNSPTVQRICRVVMTAVALGVPYYITVSKLLPGKLESALYFTALTAVYLVLCIALCSFAERFLPFVFLTERKKRAVSESGELI